jgi:ABC-2 type transport system permease protein
MYSLREHIKAFKASSWLGWQIESNWTDPLVFAVYSLVKPVAATLILVFMYLVVTGAETSSMLFSYIFVGNAFYMFVGSILFGISWAVIDDREHYETIRYIYTAPSSFLIYLLGRGVARFLIASVGVIIVMLFGKFALNIPIALATFNLPLFIASLLIGLAGVVSLGIILAGICLVVPRHSWLMNEGVAGVVYLLCGAVFPVDVLPGWLQPVSMALPFTYWLEALRRAVLGGSISEKLSVVSDGAILGILVISTIGLSVLALFTFRRFETIARRKGYIDRTTGY